MFNTKMKKKIKQTDENYIEHFEYWQPAIDGTSYFTQAHNMKKKN